MRTEIRRERTIELFLEGFRFDDLRRWKNAETEMPMALKGVLWRDTQYATDSRWSNIDFPQDETGSIIIEPTNKRKFEEKHYLLPLPTRQILLNPNLEQNPGWS
jgi:starch-binding outer membrane protein, SusD/RagB family